uniref:Uncharacterized protein n=1 Tax=Glossina pallidipes TaxID=7398 RepID=A0A1A9ZGB4_GLOPL
MCGDIGNDCADIVSSEWVLTQDNSKPFECQRLSALNDDSKQAILKSQNTWQHLNIRHSALNVPMMIRHPMNSFHIYKPNSLEYSLDIASIMEIQLFHWKWFVFLVYAYTGIEIYLKYSLRLSINIIWLWNAQSDKNLVKNLYSPALWSPPPHHETDSLSSNEIFSKKIVQTYIIYQTKTLLICYGFTYTIVTGYEFGAFFCAGATDLNVVKPKLLQLEIDWRCQLSERHLEVKRKNARCVSSLCKLKKRTACTKAPAPQSRAVLEKIIPVARGYFRQITILISPNVNTPQRHQECTSLAKPLQNNNK